MAKWVINAGSPIDVMPRRRTRFWDSGRLKSPASAYAVTPISCIECRETPLTGSGTAVSIVNKLEALVNEMMMASTPALHGAEVAGLMNLCDDLIILAHESAQAAAATELAQCPGAAHRRSREVPKARLAAVRVGRGKHPRKIPAAGASAVQYGKSHQPGLCRARRISLIVFFQFSFYEDNQDNGNN